MAEPARVPAAGSRAGTAWAIVAMVFFWPLAIGAVLASVRASRARGAGDDAVAAEQVRHVRALGIAAVVTGVVVRLVGVAVLVGAVSLADRAPVLLAAFADAAPVRDAPARPVPPTSPASPAPEEAPSRDPRGEGLGDDVSFARAKPWTLLAPGDCFEASEFVTLVPLVPCARSSAYAVYYAGDAPAGTAWPGSATGEGVADATCNAALHALGRSPQDVPWWSWFTDEDGWESSPHVMCAAQPADGVPTPSPTPEPGHDGSSADGGPTYLGVVPSPSCFDAEPLVERGDTYVPVAGFCDEPHTGQVFADDRLTLADAVDDATIWSVGREMCASAWTEFVGGEYGGPPLEIWTLAPRYTEWLAGSRVVTCAVTFDDPLTTSLVGAAG